MRSLGMAPACNVAALGGYSHADVTRITVTCGSHRLASERVSAVRSFSLSPTVGMSCDGARRKRKAKCSSKKVFRTLAQPAWPKLEANRASVKTGIAASRSEEHTSELQSLRH